MKSFASRILNVAPSLTVAIDSQAKEMKAAGFPILSMAAGEPDFATPAHICAAAHEAIERGETRYSHPAGLSELRQAICSVYGGLLNVDYHPQQITITSGAKQAIFNALQALIEPGDDVLIPSPAWVTYPELVKMLGGNPVPVFPRQGLRITAEDLDRAYTPQTKMLILNSPCNPTGIVLQKPEMQAIADWVVQKDLYCLSDEIYEKLVYQGQFVSPVSCHAGMLDRTIVVNGVSKAWAMTGWRIGFIAAPEKIAPYLHVVQGQTSHHPSTISQWAALAAIQGPQDCVETMRQEFLQRRDLVCQMFKERGFLDVSPPEGAFYFFVDIRSFLGWRTPDGQVIRSSLDLCQWLLLRFQLALVPGLAFGCEGYLRLSFATDRQTLMQGIERLHEAMLQLRF